MIDIILIIITIVAIVFSFISFRKYHNLLIRYNILQHKQDNRIENTVILRNAVYEGYLYAEENKNEFEMRTYRELLNKLKGEG